MANKLVLESKAFLSSYHHNQYHLTKHNSQQPTFLLCLAYKTKPNSPTLFHEKPYPRNPTTTSNKPFITSTFRTPKHNDIIQQKTPIGLFLETISNLLKSLKKPVVVALLAWVVMGMHGCLNNDFAWASSGGDSFDSSSSYDSSSSDGGYWSSDSRRDDYSSDNYEFYAEGRGWTQEERVRFWSCMRFVVPFILAIVVTWYVYDHHKRTARELNSIIKLQVGVLGTARSLQSELNKIALTADTSTPKGISYVLTETLRAMLQHPEYFISAYTSVDTKTRLADGKELFRQLTKEEREKFDEETLVNVNNIKKHIKQSSEVTGISNEFLVITILVAAKGLLTLPTIKGSVELKEALQKLASIPYQETIAAHVLWTSQDENDTLSAQQLRKDYPLL